MSNSSSSNNGGIGFFGLLTVVFITLKICKVIDWSWWLVFSPIFISVALFFLILGCVIIYAIWKERK